MPKGSITIRDSIMEDIIAQSEYFNEASDEYLYGLGFEPSMIRNRPFSTQRVRELLATPIKEKISHSYAAEIGGKLVGIAVIKNIKFGETADLHAHIFNLENRGKGIASAVFSDFLIRAFETFELKILVCEPLATNAAPNILLQKMGLKIVRTFDAPAMEFLRAGTINRYEISRDFVQRLRDR